MQYSNHTLKKIQKIHTEEKTPSSAVLGKLVIHMEVNETRLPISQPTEKSAQGDQRP